MAFAKKALATALLTVVATSASAALELVQTQTQAQNLLATSWNSTLTFDLFNPANFDGRSLQKVELQLSGASSTTYVFTATNSDIVRANGNFGAYIESNVSIGSNDLDINVSPGTTTTTGLVTQGTTYDFGVQTGSDTTSVVTTDAGNLAAFTGSADFDVDMKAYADITFNAVGGNYTSEQTAKAEAQFTVKYYVNELQNPPVTSVPAPASLALFGLGLLAISRKRKAA